MSFYKPEKLPKLMVAPNGARKVKKDHPAVPLTISETVATAKSCYEAGAGAIHLHVRDKEGQHVLDSGLYKEALNELEHQLTTNIGITNLYIEMNKDAEKFSQFVNDKIGVNDDKTEDAGVNEGDTIGSSTDER